MGEGNPERLADQIIDDADIIRPQIASPAREFRGIPLDGGYELACLA